MRLIFRYSIGLVFLIVFVAGSWLGLYVRSVSVGQGDVVIFIPKGSGVRQIKTILGDKGLISADVRFLILARLTGLAGRLRAGEYRVPFGISPLQVLQLLAKGDVLKHHLTIPEGLNGLQVAEVFAAQGWVDKDYFLDLLTKPAFVRSLGLKQSSLEGYLFPDTYTLVRGETSEKKIISMMVKRFHSVWQDLSVKMRAGMTMHQVVTLASMVEKETGTSAERQLIAAVFFNRLGKGMRLQSDPTVTYGLDDFQGPIKRSDLKRKTPYNTYVIQGIPPGPICNPGRAALSAVLDPADAPFLYFVSKNDGTHYFSKTIQEHNQAVRKYQK